MYDPMVEVKRAGPVSSLGSEFDDFLLAPIGEDNNGMLLSVLSALARLDIDPWEEAATLARLPGDIATRKLASLIAALPDGPSARLDSGTIATRLISLLPHRVGSDITWRLTLPRIGSVTKSPVVRYLIFCVVFMLFILASQWLVESPHAPARPNSAAAHPASSASAQSTQLSTGR